jgi:Domain of unknown function (DUF4145)
VDMIEFLPDTRPRALECPMCGKAVIAEPRGFTVTGINIEDEEYLERWTLYACEKEHPILTSEDGLGASLDGEGNGNVDFDDDPYRVYPPQERPLSAEIPTQLQQIHEEARACIRAKAYTAAAVMSGRTLEGVCEMHGVRGGTLQNRLVKMKEQGLIDGRLWEWAEMLRAVRNSAAHFSANSISKQDAEDAVAFTEALLDYLYVLTARFNALKKRLANKAPSSSEAGDQDVPDAPPGATSTKP